MSLKVGELFAELGLDDSSFHSGMRANEGAFGKFGTKLGSMAATAAKAITVALIGAATASLVSFTKFEGGMNEVFTLLPGITEDAMGDMTDQVKAFAKEFGRLPSEVVPALYQSISAGIPQDNVFKFLAVAQKAAVGGVTELETAVNGISSVINAYGKDVMTAAQASDIMFTGVRLGKTTFRELSDSLFNVVPAASALKVGFGDVTAALVSMTAQGVPTSVATTQLRQMLVELSKTGQQAADGFARIAGKSFRQFIAEGGTLQKALQLIEADMSKLGYGVNEFFGSVEAGQAILTLTGAGSATFAANLLAMGDAAGATEAAYARMEQGLGRSFDKIKAAGAVLLLDVGEKLAPTVKEFADWLVANSPAISDAVIKSMDDIGASFQWLTDNVFPGLIEGYHWVKETFFSDTEQVKGTMSELQTTINDILIGIGGIISGFVDLVKAIWARWGNEITVIVVAAWNMVKGVIQAAILVIQGILDIFIGLFTGDWNRMVDGVVKIWDGMWQGIGAILKGFVTITYQIIKGLVDLVVGLIVGLGKMMWDGMRVAADGMVALWESLKTAVVNLAKALYTGVKDWLVGKFKSVVDSLGKSLKDIEGFFKGLYDAVVGHSYIPDMVEQVAQLMEKMAADMSRLSGQGCDAVNTSFKNMGRGFHQTSNDASMAARMMKNSFLTAFGEIGRATADLIGNLGMMWATGSGDWRQIIVMFLDAAMRIIITAAIAAAGIAELVSKALSQMWNPLGWIIIAGLLIAMAAIRNKLAADMAAQTPALAEGGTIMSPGQVLVGERGPELLRLPRGASVIPLNHPAAGNGGFGEQLIQLYLDGRLIAQTVARNMPSVLQVQGVNV